MGVIAAQSIGEPGNTVDNENISHWGAAQKGTEVSNIESKVKGKVKYINLNLQQIALEIILTCQETPLFNFRRK